MISAGRRLVPAAALLVLAGCGSDGSGTLPVPEATLSVVLAGGGEGRVVSVPAGIDCDTDGNGSTCSADFAEGAAVALSATPRDGSDFGGWSGACSGDGACALTLDGDRSVTATFLAPPPPATLTIEVVGDGSGTVMADPAEAGLSCDTGQGTCRGTLEVGTEVSLTAEPEEGSEFAGWGGACSGTGSCTFVLEDDATVSADFNDPTLATATVGTDGGTLSTDDGVVELAVPEGALSAEQTLSVATITADDLGPEFDDLRDAVERAYDMGPDGLEFSVPASISMRLDGAAPAAGAAEIAGRVLWTLQDGEAVPLGGATAAVDGEDVVVGAEIEHFTPVTLDRDPVFMTVTGIPEEAQVGVPFDISVRLSFVQNRFFFLSGGRFEDASTAPVAPTFQGVQDLTPSSEPGLEVYERFLGYQCVEEGEGRLAGYGIMSSVSAFGDMTLGPVGRTVKCVPPPQKKLTVTLSGDGSGTVTSEPAGIDCPPNCEMTVEMGTEVTLTATPAEGSTFCGWTSGSNTEASSVIRVTVDRDGNVDACFDDEDTEPIRWFFDPRNVEATANVVAAGTQDVPFYDGMGTSYMGSVPVEFGGNQTYVGTDPDRFGLGQNGFMDVHLGEGSYPEPVPSPADLRLRVCGVENGSETQVRIRRFDDAGALITEQIIDLLNGCHTFDGAFRLVTQMLSAAFADFTMDVSLASMAEPVDFELGGG